MKKINIGLIFMLGLVALFAFSFKVHAEPPSCTAEHDINSSTFQKKNSETITATKLHGSEKVSFNKARDVYDIIVYEGPILDHNRESTKRMEISYPVGTGSPSFLVVRRYLQGSPTIYCQETIAIQDTPHDTLPESPDGGSDGGGGGDGGEELPPINEANITSNVDYGEVECTTDGGQKGIQTVFGCVEAGPGSLPYYVSLVFSWVAGIIGVMAVAGLVYAGYTYTTSGGNPDSIAKAKDIIVTSISSVVIIIFSWAFFKLLGVF